MKVFKKSIAYLLNISIFFTGVMVFAGSNPVFSLESEKTAVVNHSYFSFDVEGNNINDLYALEIELAVDKERVRLTKATTALPDVFETSPVQEENIIHFAFTKVGKSSPENGSVKLCSLTFQALGEGTADFKLNSVKVVHTNLKEDIYEPKSLLKFEIANQAPVPTQASTPGTTPPPVTPTTTATLKGTGTPAPTSGAGQVSRTGWLIDYDCVGANPYTHTQDCNLMPSCIASGEGIYVYTAGKAYNTYGASDWIPFDQASQALAAQLDRILSEPDNPKSHLGKYPNRIPTIKVNGYTVTSGLPSNITDYTAGIHITSIEFHYIPGVSNYEVTEPENVVLSQTPAPSATYTPAPVNNTSPTSEAVLPTPVPTTQETKEDNEKDIPAAGAYRDFENHWAKEYIAALLSKNIISGYEDGSIRPDQLISRAEISKILVLALGYDTKNFEVPSYSDWDGVAGWAEPYVGILSAKGILKGYEDNTVRAEKNISRAELITLVLRAFGTEPSKYKITGASDGEKVPEWAAGYVQKGIELGIVNGYTDNTLRVSNPIRRGEAFKILVKSLETLKDAQFQL